MNEAWMLTWVFRNGHTWEKRFLTEEEAMAYADVLALDVDPNIETWSLAHETPEGAI